MNISRKMRQVVQWHTWERLDMHAYVWSVSLKEKAGYTRWEDTIKIKLTEVEWHVVDWMHLSEDQEL